MFYKANKLKDAAKQKTMEVRGRIQKNGIGAYWWTGHRNFGDLITPALLQHYGLTPVYQGPASADLVSTGSILQQISPDFSRTVLGSGIIQDMDFPLPNARFLAVRGNLTRKCVGAPINTPLGDPGLLVARLIKSKSRKQYSLGVVPHYSEKSDNKLQLLIARLGKAVRIIDVEQNPKNVLRDIASCETILSSSLHGIIVSHALGIPTAWLKLTDQLKGGNFKFEDYGSAIDYRLEPTTIDGSETIAELTERADLPKSDKLKDRITELDEIFSELARSVRQQQSG